MKSQIFILDDHKLVRKLIDYILLNAYSAHSDGLYNGKTGVILTLFETARYLKDRYIKERADELLQESLFNRGEDIGFEEGLSGIGYALHYLIKNEFIKADFHELYKEKLYKVISTLKKWEDERSVELFLRNVNIVFFLNTIHDKNKEVKHLIEIFSEIMSSNLETQLNESNDITSSIPKMNILHSFSNYLKLANHCTNFNISHSILYQYAEAYRKGKFISDFAIGHYLYQIALEYQCKNIEFIAKTNKKCAIDNLQIEPLSLSARLDLLYLLSTYKVKYQEQIDALESIFGDIEDEMILEKSLSESISPNSFMSGYQSGVSRFILYWIYKQHIINQQSSERFKNIF